MGWLSRTGLIAAALVAVALVVPLAGANGPMGGTETVTMNLPADGNGAATRSPMPASSTVGTVDVSGTSDDPDFLNALTPILSSAPSRGARVVTCVSLYAQLSGSSSFPVSFTLEEPSLQVLFLYMCIEVALAMSKQSAAHHGLAHAATGGCTPLAETIPVHITKTSTGYKATVNATATKAKKVPFRVTCRRSAKSIHLSVRSNARKGKLAKAVGSKLGVGFVSKSASPAKLKIALGVR